MVESGARTTLITGASGNVGRKVAAHLAGQQGRRLVLLDRTPDSDGNVIVADLRRFDPAWTRHFHGVDVVVHLAADPRPAATWPALAADNVDAVLNVFEAAVAGGVKRVVFASSLQAALGYDGDLERIGAGLPPYPINAYGASKGVGERIGRSFAARHGLSVVCLRIGMVRRGANRAPIGHPDVSVQHRWLSNEDLCRAVTLAIDAAAVDFAVVNITSAVLGSPWTLDEAMEVLGYEPSSHHVPVPPTAMQRLRRRLGRLSRVRAIRRRA